MANFIKDLTINWTWDGDIYALKGFNIVVTPEGNQPYGNGSSIVANATVSNEARSHTFKNLTLDNTINYEIWIQALYEGGDGEWLSSGGTSIPDDGYVSIIASKQDVNYAIQTNAYFEYGKSLWSTSYEGEVVPELTGQTIVEGVGDWGGKVLEFTGTPYWIYYANPIPVDVNKTYKGRFRVKQTVDATTGGSYVYAGVVTLDKNYNNLTGGSGTHRYFIVSSQAVKVADGWQTFEGTISGVGDGRTNFRAGTAYVRPMFIVNYNAGNGTAQVDGLEFCEVPEEVEMGVNIKLSKKDGIKVIENTEERVVINGNGITINNGAFHIGNFVVDEGGTKKVYVQNYPLSNGNVTKAVSIDPENGIKANNGGLTVYADSGTAGQEYIKLGKVQPSGLEPLDTSKITSGIFDINRIPKNIIRSAPGVELPTMYWGSTFVAGYNTVTLTFSYALPYAYEVFLFTLTANSATNAHTSIYAESLSSAGFQIRSGTSYGQTVRWIILAQNASPADVTCNICQVNCQLACQSNCQETCELSSQSCGSCENYCQTSCESTCQTSCQDSCQTACEAAPCQTTCELNAQSCQIQIPQ